MAIPPSAVVVCVCTYRRASLADALNSLTTQQLSTGRSFKVVVVDNDSEPSAEGLVSEFTAQLPIRYIHAPANNIAIARNACLDHAGADWIAFLDDDEIAEPEWLDRLIDGARGADVVFGPQVAIYPPGAPVWMVRGDFHSSRPTRKVSSSGQGSSGNVLLELEIPGGLAFAVTWRWGSPVARTLCSSTSCAG